MAAAAAALPGGAMAALASMLLLLATCIHAQNAPQDFVDAHNSARNTVGVGPVTWDDTLAAYAEDYANTRAADCSQVPFSNGPYGENLALNPDGANAADAVSLWLSYQMYYAYGSNRCAAGFVSQCLAYTQLVWSTSVTIGCARVECSGGASGVLFVCEYNPAGNLPGKRPY